MLHSLKLTSKGQVLFVKRSKASKKPLRPFAILCGSLRNNKKIRCNLKFS